MRISDEIKAWSSLSLIFGMFFLAAGYVFMAISVNSGRIDRIRNIQEQIQKKAADFARAESGPAREQLQQQLLKLNEQLDNVNRDILSGNGDPLSFGECFLPLNPACFHRNSSENNNLWLALASGALGVILFLLRDFRSGATLDSARAQNSDILFSVLSLIPTGMIVGLLTLFLLRGTKGALLAPVGDVVQVENPYGTAFACTIAALFSDRIIGMLSRLIDAVPVKWQGPPEP